MVRIDGDSAKCSSDTTEEEFDGVVVAQEGDVCLKILDRETHMETLYSCSRKTLRSASAYFDVLFDPVKFNEGIAIEAELQELYRLPGGVIPSVKLPTVTINDVGELPPTGVSTHSLLKLFLSILHDETTPWTANRSQSLNLVALLAIVADRFSASAPIAAYLRKQKMDISLFKDKKSISADRLERENRQRLLAGVVFGFSQWVLQYSAALIMEGSKRWTSTHTGSGDEGDKGDDGAIWWALPAGIEEEILCRREYILDTLSSVQKHFIALYSSRQPQCRLGYESSPNCDSYQLGEMIRFFTRKGFLRIESALATDTEENLEPYNGSIEDIIVKLKECPSYQIDRNHSHCGLRTRLMPILESLWPLNSVWICLECWRVNKSKESWLDNPRGGTWFWHKKPPLRDVSRCQAHREAKAMFTATTRDWTPATSA